MPVSLSSAALAQANTPAATTASTTAAQENPTTAALNKISPALGKAHERVRSELQSGSASLSQLGKYKATVADLASAALALSQLGHGTHNATHSSTDSAKVVERFVTAYNQAITASRPDTSSEASNTLASSRRTLTNASDTSRSQLASLGLSRQADGTLKLDTAALNKALAASVAPGNNGGTSTALSTLNQLGKAIGKRADNELASDSRLASATSLFSGKVSHLKQQQIRLLETATQLSARSSAGNNTGTNASNWATQQALRRYST